MRRASITLAALLALAGLTACAMKDEAPAREGGQATAASSEPMAPSAEDESATGSKEEELFADAPATIEVAAEKPGYVAGNGPAQAQRAREQATLGGDQYDNDMDGDDPEPVLEELAERAPPPPPAPKAAPVQMHWDINADDGEFAGEVNGAIPAGGLALRGAGRGGGGTGEGRIGGLGKLDTGGGKGFGGEGKKKSKARKARRLPSEPPTDGVLALGRAERSRSSARSQLLGGDLLDDVIEEADEEEPERSEVFGEARKEAEKKVAQGIESENRRRDELADRQQEAQRDRWKNGLRDEKADASKDGQFEAMLEPLEDKEIDGRFEVAEYPERFVQPGRFIPRMCYFENTYLGGNAAYTERLRRLDDALPRGRQPYRAAALPRQPFDAPDDAGLALTATLDRAYVDQPQRVFLQVGLQGSKRFGWRRPPLDIALVVDGSANDGETLVEAITALSRRLGPQDRLGVILATTRPIVLGELAPLRDRLVLARAIEALGTVPAGPPGALGAAMNRAGGMLQAAAGDSARIPGTQTVLVLTRGANDSRIEGARGAAHALTVQGAVTSVIQLGGSHQGWWQVANAGHGNYHRATDAALADAVDEELGSISKVIARLLRINVKLADGVEAIRVVGSRVLGQQEVKQVKAREEATDRNLSKTMGVKADRGDDDDGIQTVIPYFYGGDSHVILIELWVSRPGPVAEVSLKYKDMVALQNATARVAAQLERVPRDLTPAERRVAANVRGFQLAEGLATAAGHAERGDRQSALNALDALDRLAFGRDQRLVDAFADLVQQRGADRTVAEALRMAHDRRIGHSP